MIPEVLITNGDSHPASVYAELSASEIIAIPQDADGPNAKAGRRLELQLLDILEVYYDHVIAAEKAKLDEDGDGRLESPLDGKEHDPSEVITQIQAITKGGPFEEHFLKPEVTANIVNVLNHHVMVTQDVERSWYADENVSDITEAWKIARQEKGIQLAHLGPQVLKGEPIPDLTDTPPVTAKS